MITFTVPESIRMFIRSHQRVCYSSLFKASSETMKVLALDPKYMGGDLPGFFGVLHTWGALMQYHPHIHYVAPGGAMTKEDGTWHPSRIDFYLPVRAMSKIYRAKFRDEMKKTGLYSMIPTQARETDWNVNCQAVGEGDRSIKYLSLYVFKVAIADSRIVDMKGKTVSFKYRKKGSSRMRTCTLDALEFIRRYLQHVLPTGFMKIRYFGFLHPCSSVSIDEIRTKIQLIHGFEIAYPDDLDDREEPMLYCPLCGGRSEYVCSYLPYMFPGKPPDNT